MNLQEYYINAELFEPPNIEQREFGIFKGDVMWRHLKFNNMIELRGFLLTQKPDHVYFSISKYNNPSARSSNGESLRDAKGWLGADLIFDIDYDHLTKPTMREAERMAINLYHVLMKEYALEDVTLVFSGSRGFHIHVRDERIQSLNGNERTQIVEDLEARGIEIDAPVTTDLSRLIRLPGSIHGKTNKACRILKKDGSDVK